MESAGNTKPGRLTIHTWGCSYLEVYLGLCLASMDTAAEGYLCHLLHLIITTLNIH